jgi:hypothetical protein
MIKSLTENLVMRCGIEGLLFDRKKSLLETAN